MRRGVHAVRLPILTHNPLPTPATPRPAPRLRNLGGLASKNFITWRGQTYAGTRNGLPQGALNITDAWPLATRGDTQVYRVRVPAGQAVLLVTSAKRGR